jgi:hypothetical protein
MVSGVGYLFRALSLSLCANISALYRLLRCDDSGTGAEKGRYFVIANTRVRLLTYDSPMLALRKVAGVVDIDQCGAWSGNQCHFCCMTA